MIDLKFKDSSPTVTMVPVMRYPNCKDVCELLHRFFRDGSLIKRVEFGPKKTIVEAQDSDGKWHIWEFPSETRLE